MISPLLLRKSSVSVSRYFCTVTKNTLWEVFHLFSFWNIHQPTLGPALVCCQLIIALLAFLDDFSENRQFSSCKRPQKVLLRISFYEFFVHLGSVWLLFTSSICIKRWHLIYYKWEICLMTQLATPPKKDMNWWGTLFWQRHSTHRLHLDLLPAHILRSRTVLCISVATAVTGFYIWQQI